MKILSLTVLVALLMGCNSNVQKKQLADLNLYFDTTIKKDSVLVTNITQDREFHFVKYAGEMNIDLNDSINDLYAINFFSGNDHKMVQLWLDGKNLVIKGKVADNIRIQVDTVIGSDLYYKSLHFRQEYENLLVAKTDSSAVNDFLINKLGQEINSPLSIDIANNFFYRNFSNPDELKKLFAILSTQHDLVKNHLINPYRKVESILSVNRIDFSKYRFYDRDKKLTSINLSDDKKYLVDFWFIECLPCLQDHQSIISKLNLLKDKNVEIIGVSIDESQEKWKNFLNEKKYAWKNYREIDEPENKLRTKMLIDAFPTYLLLDNKGVILYRSNTFSGVEKYLGL